MFAKIQKFFLELQQSDEATKKRWMTILTSGTMMVVIGLWGVYINMTIQNLDEKEQAKNEIGFLKTFKSGLTILSKETGLKLSELSAYLGSLANQTNSITIQGASSNFVLKNIEDIKPNKLP